jgi:hypothetical protein
MAKGVQRRGRRLSRKRRAPDPCRISPLRRERLDRPPLSLHCPDPTTSGPGLHLEASQPRKRVTIHHTANATRAMKMRIAAISVGPM